MWLSERRPGRWGWRPSPHRTPRFILKSLGSLGLSTFNTGAENFLWVQKVAGSQSWRSQSYRGDVEVSQPLISHSHLSTFLPQSPLRAHPRRRRQSCLPSELWGQRHPAHQRADHRGTLHQAQGHRRECPRHQGGVCQINGNAS